jgi:outer membrane protein OmpA-like peptidoglycan-associated protein
MNRIFIALLFLSGLVQAQVMDDKPGCADHPLVTRMKNFRIYECTTQEFSDESFYHEKDGTLKVGGRYSYLGYEWISGGSGTVPSSEQVVANYVNALVKLGAKVIYRSTQQADLVLTKNGQETWAEVQASSGSYRLKIVQREGMKQDVAATADFMKQGLKETGKVALYGILFDTGKSTLRPESGPVLQEISLLLKGDKTLTVFVVGHTDNVGDYAMNLKLSSDRAAAVIRELTTKYAVAAAQLIPFGAGPTSPVASNDTDQGRQLNRRVELVKK